MDKEETELNALREEFNAINLKKNYLRDHNEIIKE